MIHVSLKVKSFPMIAKSFGIIKMIKLLEFQGPWAELHVRICSIGVLGGVVGAGGVVGQDRAGAESFDRCFCVIFDSRCNCFYRVNTKYCAILRFS